MGYDFIVGNFLIQITVGKNRKALQMKLDQFTEPAGGWKVVFLTMVCNKKIVIPAIHGLQHFSKTKDVYIGHVDFQDACQPPIAGGPACQPIAN